MSLRTDPSGHVEVYLDVDSEVPEDRRPVFMCQNVTCRQAALHTTALNRLMKEEQDEVARTLRIAEALGELVVGFRNIPQSKTESVRETKDVLLDCCTTTELFELFYKIVGGMVTREDKKK